MSKETETARLVKDENPHFKCKQCGTNDHLFYTTGETFDGAYDTYEYDCRGCGYQWRVVAEID